jgi:acyl-CoA synthetase (AMP-forming)/AMP-acid ligase II
VINVSGHRIGTAEVESALVSHPQCAEAAVVGFDHEVDHFSWVVVTVDTSLFSSFWYMVSLCVYALQEISALHINRSCLCHIAL